jgi:enoyl-CoA hydratase
VKAGPLAVQAIKKSVLAGRDLHHTAALEKEMEIGVPVSMSEDCREGTKAFKEKRKLVFHGRSGPLGGAFLTAASPST